MEPDPAEAEFSVEPENWPALEAFRACETQWIYGSMGGVIGMNYPGVQSHLHFNVPRRERAAIFRSIQIMERAALAVFNESKS
ncbi:DUF1799 domain-containing protein [Methylomonas sp. MED-D]|uniref:DUF1799 domain-containing protein n=1 Tax=unclassified Methylomonas TaxID=2608980 RepID=UPI003CFD0913